MKVKKSQVSGESAGASKSRKGKKKGKQKWNKKALKELVASKDNVVIPHQVKQLKSDPHAKISLSKKKLRKLEKAKRRNDREKERMEIEPPSTTTSSTLPKKTKKAQDTNSMEIAD